MALDRRLDGNPGAGVDRQACVEDGIRDLVADLVGVTVGNALGGKTEVSVSGCGIGHQNHLFVPRRRGPKAPRKSRRGARREGWFSVPFAL